MAVLTIAITGPTGAGKSTLAAAVTSRFPDLEPVVLNQDRYFRSWMELSAAERERRRTTNHPRAVLWERLIADLRALRGGGRIRWPVAGTRRAADAEAETVLGPTRLLIVEGHLLFNRPEVSELADLRVFVDTYVHERVVRRLLRDTASGRTTLEAATAWYRRDVIPNVARYSEALLTQADVVVPFDGENGKAVDVIADWVASRNLEA